MPIRANPRSVQQKSYRRQCKSDGSAIQENAMGEKSKTARTMHCKSGRCMGKAITLTREGLMDAEVGKNIRTFGVRFDVRSQQRSWFRKKQEGSNNRISRVHTGRRAGAMTARYRRGFVKRDSVERDMQKFRVLKQEMGRRMTVQRTSWSGFWERNCSKASEMGKIRSIPGAAEGNPQTG